MLAISKNCGLASQVVSSRRWRNAFSIVPLWPCRFRTMLASLSCVLLLLSPILINAFVAPRWSTARMHAATESELQVTREDVETLEFTKEQLFVNWMTADSLIEIPHPGKTLQIQGSIPSYVRGSYIKNGPGAFATSDGSRRYTHAFDGLAKLQKFDIEVENQVTFTTKFVDSKIKKAMLAPKNPHIPGHLSTGPVDPPFPLWDVLINTLGFDNACVNVEELSSSGTVCAVTDASIRMEIDPETLETIRRIPDGRIEGVWGISQIATAHSKVARRDGLTYNYYLELGLQNWAHIVRTNRDLTQTSIGKVLIEDRISYVHEISVTDNYAILCQHPLFLDLAKSVSKGALLPNLDFDPTVNTQIHIFDLEGIKPVQSFTAPSCWAYHHVNAYEVGSNVILDIVAYDDAAITNGPHAYLYMDNMKTEANRAKQAKEGTVWRFVMDLNSNGHFVDPERKIVYNEASKLPTVMELISVSPKCLGRPYRYVYGFTGFFQGKPGYLDWAIVKQDVAQNERHGTWHEELCYPGEPLFVRDPEGKEEDDGVLLSTVYDARRGENFLLVLNASTMKELARAYTGVGLCVACCLCDS
jgi:beta,beta-carotene 9',10'-dioxygenase